MSYLGPAWATRSWLPERSSRNRSQHVNIKACLAAHEGKRKKELSGLLLKAGVGNTVPAPSSSDI